MVTYIEDDLITQPTIELWLRDLQFPFNKDCGYNQIPTLSEVAKWLREEHHLFCQVILMFNKRYTGNVINMNIGKSETINGFDECWEDYAACLEYLINQALCLLKSKDTSKKTSNTNN